MPITETPARRTDALSGPVHYSCQSLVPGKGTLPADVATAWAEQAAASKNPDRLYQSPVWLDHKLGTSDPGPDIDLCVVRGSKGIVAVLPTHRCAHDFSIRVGRRVNLRNTLRARTILGNDPPLADDYSLHAAAFRSLLAGDVEALSFRMLPLRSPVHDSLKRLVSEDSRYRLFTVNACLKRHLIDLPASFEEYLSQFDAKKRYNLKRQPKVLGKAHGAEAHLREYTQANDASRFLAVIEPIVARSWQREVSDDVITRDDRWVREFRSLADRGLFRSFVLFVGNQPIAFCVGLQHDGVFYFDTTAYNPDYGKFSPGSVLLYLLLEALIRDRSRLTRTVSFGYGDHAYKQSFGNVHEEVTEVLLVRARLRTTVKWKLFAWFRQCVRLYRRGRV